MERVVRGTFGPVDWRAYYRRRFPVDDVLAAKPCRRCPHKGECNKSINPAHKSPCWRWIKWCRQIWPVVTGKKKAAHSGANTEDG